MAAVSVSGRWRPIDVRANSPSAAARSPGALIRIVTAAGDDIVVAARIVPRTRRRPMSNRMKRPSRCGPSLTHMTRAVVSMTTPWVAMRASMARRSPRGNTASPAPRLSRKTRDRHLRRPRLAASRARSSSTTGAARERARLALHLKVRRIVRPGPLEVVGERGFARAAADMRRLARSPFDDRDIARCVGEHHDVAHHGLARESVAMASSVERASTQHVAHRVHERLAELPRLAARPP